MSRRSQFFIVLAMLAAATGFARLAVPATHASPSAVSMANEQWKEVTDWVTKAAEQVPDTSYAFKPTASVRSFGQLVGHIAGTQDLMCAAILGEKLPAEDAVEKGATTKAALVAALKASTEHCKKAYAISDADAGKTVKLFGVEKSALYWLVSNMAHDNLHYGNMVTYMRVMGMVPPSSQSP